MKHQIRKEVFDRLADPVIYTGRHGDSRARFDRDVSGRCQKPVSLDLTARDDRNKDRPAAFLDLSVPCRSCEPCRRQRASVWRVRATKELSYARDCGRRSWFVTLTMRPTAHSLLRLKAIKRFNDRGKDPSASSFEGLSETDLQRSIERQSAIEVVKYLKRLRKASGARFRYLIVAECHEGPGENHGQVHYHCLVIEVLGELRERLFRQQWQLGFAHAVLVKADSGAAAYATKVARYISKSISARVRASKSFGCPLASIGVSRSERAPRLVGTGAPLSCPTSRRTIRDVETCGDNTEWVPFSAQTEKGEEGRQAAALATYVPT